MKFIGRVVTVLPIVTGQKKDGGQWSRCDFVVKEEKQYGDEFVISAFGDKIDKVAYLKPNTMVEVVFDGRVREFNGKYFQTNSLFAIEIEGQAKPQPQRQVEQKSAPQSPNAFGANSDGLPF